MDYKEFYDPEIDLKSLFFYILYKWRSVIAVAILCCGLFAAYKAVRNMGISPEDLVSPKIKEYELDMAKYELDLISYEREIKSNSTQLEQQQKYVENSVMMRINPYNKPVATADIFVKLDDAEWEILPDNLVLDPTDSLIKMYTSNFSAILDWNPIEELTGNKKLYLEEALWLGADYNSNTITVRVVYPDGETAQKLLDIVLSQILDRQETLANGAGMHTLIVSNQSLTYVIDHSLAESQKANLASITNYERSLIDYGKELDDLKANEPQKPFVLGFIKYPVVGFVFGGLLMVVFYGMSYILGIHIHGEQSLRDRYGYRLLGVLPRQYKSGPLSCLDRFLDKHSSLFRSCKSEEVYERISINLKNINQKSGKILVTGTVSIEDIQMFTEAISQRLNGFMFIAAPDMNKNTETLRCLAECDGVLLLEKEDCSSVTEVNQEHDNIKSLEKPVIGYVLL